MLSARAVRSRRLAMLLGETGSLRITLRLRDACTHEQRGSYDNGQCLTRASTRIRTSLFIAVSFP